MRMSTEFTDVSSEKLHSTVHRLNEYRALASPVFIAASFLQNVRSGPDPVLRACALSREFRDISEQEYEFRKEYLRLCNDYEEFTVSLLKGMLHKGRDQMRYGSEERRKNVFFAGDRFS